VISLSSSIRRRADLYRSSEAKTRQAARLAAETAKAEAAQALASASAKERRRLRQQRRRAAARMLAAGMTQVEAADPLGLTDRTIPTERRVTVKLDPGPPLDRLSLSPLGGGRHAAKPPSAQRDPAPLVEIRRVGHRHERRQPTPMPIDPNREETPC
jgi:hypothetical protein